MPEPDFNVVVLGDSSMWGQGLRESDKFAVTSVAEIGRRLGRRARIVENSARSGAVIRAGNTSSDARAARETFVDTFPHLFTPDSSLKNRFLADTSDRSQDVALSLHRESPASFPTVEKQVARIPQATGVTTNLVLLNGGANDLDFEVFLNPEEHRADFVTHFDPILKEIAYDRVRSLLQQARRKFPHAVILYTGYFAPMAPGVSNDELETFFEDESGSASYEIWLNNNIIELKDVDRLVVEDQYRAYFGAARALHWTRAAVSEMNADPGTARVGYSVHPSTLWSSEHRVCGKLISALRVPPVTGERRRARRTRP